MDARKRRRRVRALLGAAAISVLSLGIWAFWIEPARVVVRELPLRIPRWRPEHRGLRIAVIADLHVGAPHVGLDKLRRVVGETNARRPDLVLVLGDLVIHGVVGGRFVAPEPIAEGLGALRAPHGTVAVLGNHDGWLDRARVRRALERSGIRVLENDVERVEARGAGFWLAGIEDLWTGKPDIPGTLAKVPGGEPILLLSHNPDVFPDVPDRPSLTIAGHTHGGQVDLPVLGRPVVPSRFGQRYAAGHVVEEGRHLFVTTGVGTSILPVRFRVPPEVVILSLEPLP